MRRIDLWKFISLVVLGMVVSSSTPNSNKSMNSRAFFRDAYLVLLGLKTQQRNANELHLSYSCSFVSNLGTGVPNALRPFCPSEILMMRSYVADRLPEFHLRQKDIAHFLEQFDRSWCIQHRFHADARGKTVRMGIFQAIQASWEEPP
jgi:hypothetical protein